MNATLPYIVTRVPNNGANKLVKGIMASAPFKQVIQWTSPIIVSQETRAI